MWRDLLCACAVDIWLYLQYYWANLAQTCSLRPLAMSWILSLRLIHAVHALTTPFCNWRWPISKTDSTQEQNLAPHPAVGAERLADVRNSSAKFGFSSSFSITSTLCVKNGISSKQFGIHSKRFDKVCTSHIRTNVMKLTAHWPNDLEMPKVVHNVQFTMTNVQSVLLIGQSVVEFIEVFRSMTNCRICRRIVMEHWPNANEKRCSRKPVNSLGTIFRFCW